MADHSTLAPLSLDDPAPFMVDTGAQVQHLLSRLAKRPELVCIYPPGKREPFALSALLQVADDHLIFDTSPDERVNKLLENASRLVCVSNLDRVHIQFEAPKPMRIEHKGLSALRAERPKNLLFIQRRDYFRLSIPARQPVLCHIPIGTIDNCLTVEISDISLGGIALPGPLPIPEAAIGMKLLDCQLELPEIGIVKVDLLICSLRENRLRDGTRIGCRFIHPSAGTESLIQRYINRIERSRIARE